MLAILLSVWKKLLNIWVRHLEMLGYMLNYIIIVSCLFKYIINNTIFFIINGLFLCDYNSIIYD